MPKSIWWRCFNYQGHTIPMVIRDTYLVGMQTHGGSPNESEILQLPFQRWNGSEERSTKLVVTYHRTQQPISQMNSDL